MNLQCIGFLAFISDIDFTSRVSFQDPKSIQYRSRAVVPVRSSSSIIGHVFYSTAYFALLLDNSLILTFDSSFCMFELYSPNPGNPLIAI